MKYCYNCNRITVGKPFFCNSCGRSYNVKLCPRLHANPRSAEVCSQCGSRDLSAPGPKVPLWVPVLQFLMSLIPGLIVGFLSVAVCLLLIQQILTQPGMLAPFVFLGIGLAILWWMWSQIPAWFRKAVYKLLKRRRDGEGRNGHS